MASFGTAGGGSGQGSATVGGSQVISPLAIPELLKLFGLAQEQTPMRNDMNSLQSIVQGGANSPLLQAVLGPALMRLQAPQAQQRQNLTEATRAAGGLRGSTYGQDFNELQNNQALQTNDLMAQVIQQMLAPLISGQLQEQRNSFLPAESLTNLLRAASPSVGRGGASASSSRDSIAPSGGLSTPMSPTPGFDAYGAQLNAPRIGGSATVGPNAGGMGGNATVGVPQSPPQPYTPYLDPMSGAGGGWYDLGGGQEWLGGPGAQTNPYQHNYGEAVPVVEEGWW